MEAPSGALASINITDKTSWILGDIKQIKKLLQLSHHNTFEATHYQGERRWVIKSIRTQLSTEEIKTQLERDNPAITVKQVVRITSKTKDPTTVVIITSEEYNVSKAVNFNKQSPQPENYVPRVLRCSRCIKAFHSRADCRMKQEIFWYCSASHQFNQCQQQTQIS